MTVYFSKNRKIWVYDFQLNSERHQGYCVDPKTSASAKSKSEAKAIETKIKASLLEGVKAAQKNIRVTTFAEAMAAYTAQAKLGKSWSSQKLYVRELLAYFGASTPLSSITETRVWEYIGWSRRQKLKIWTGGGIRPGDPLPLGKTEKDCWRETDRLRSDSTINRYLDALRKSLGIMAKQRHPVTGQPLLIAPPKVSKLKEPDALPRPISSQDLSRIIATAPQHLGDAVTALFTGSPKT